MVESRKRPKGREKKMIAQALTLATPIIFVIMGIVGSIIWLGRE
jgi:hypothetical protein